MEFLIFVLIFIVLSIVILNKFNAVQKDAETAKVDTLRLQEKLSKYEILISKEEYEEQLDLKIQAKQENLDRLSERENDLEIRRRDLQVKVRELEEEEFVQSFGFYQSKYDFEDSERYKVELDRIRAQQKNLISDKMAVICRTEWHVEGSKTKGKKMVNNFLKLVLRAFNGECDAAILKVKYNNMNSLTKRINKAFESLNKLSESTHCEITQDYLNLKLEELHLTHEFQVKKQEEREEQRQIREQMREEERTLREIEKAKEEAEREEKRYEQALEKAREESERATDRDKDRLEQKIQELNQKLEEAHKTKERAISRAQVTKSGHVYIISNLGSFGENVYKIGMTRRIDPLDRVKELGDASVPFSFDVHAIIFSENAPELEKLLHQHFQDRQLNKVNPRKEFFRVSLDDIVAAVQQITRQVEGIQSEIHFTKVAEAAEYRQTLALERQTSV